MQEMRAFIAIPLSKALRSSLSSVGEHLQEAAGDVRGLTFVEQNCMHITLKFLGDIEVSRILHISAAIREALSTIPPFTISVNGVSGLPRIEKPRVVFGAVDDPSGSLADIAKRLDRMLPDLPRDHKRFKPHITLMRIKHPKAWERVVGTMEGVWTRQFGQETINRVVLLESVLQRSGPVYSIIDEFDL